MAKSCLLLINPNARSGETARDQAEDSLSAAGFKIDCPKTTSPQDSHDAIRDTQCDLIVLGGGDGTIAEAAPALLDAGKVFGVLPLGTANDLAGSLGIPKRLDAAIAVLAEGDTQPIDVGFVNGRPFFNAVTIGLGADVVRSHSGEMKKRLGIFNYPRVIVQSMRNRQYFTAHVNTDGQTKSARLLHVGIANGRYHGGGLPAHQDATIDDGILHLYAVRRATPMRYARSLPSLLLGRHSDDLLRLAGERIEIDTEPAMPATADGEEIGQTPLTLSCQAGALRVMVPKSGIAGG